VNISNPENPVEVGNFETSSYASGIAVAGVHAFVTDYFGGLRIIRVSDAVNPIEVGYYHTTGIAFNVAVAGTYAYVADEFFFEIFDCSQAVPVPEVNRSISPVEFSLLPAYPNPFNSATSISYQVAAGGRVQLVIYDLLGRQVGTLVNRMLAPGTYSATWDAKDLASGIYFCRMSVRTPSGEAGEFQQVRKLVVLK
jgi:hypothetical protein